MGIAFSLVACDKEELNPVSHENGSDSDVPVEVPIPELRTGDDDDETFSLRGKVKNSSSVGISNATVDLLEFPTEIQFDSDVSDSEGDYQIDGMPEDWYILEVNASGYQEFRDTIFINDTTDMDILLIP